MIANGDESPLDSGADIETSLAKPVLSCLSVGSSSTRFSFTLEGVTLPPGYEFYDLQVAGHQHKHERPDPHRFNVLYFPAERVILKPIQVKPRGPREVFFYESVWLSDSDEVDVNAQSPLSSLRSLVPKYFGTTSLDLDDVSFLKLEDLTDGYLQPCVMDVKIGRQTWDPAAPPEKIARDSTKYPLGEKLGFRLLGMKYYDCASSTFQCKDKQWGLGLCESDIMPAFHQFFQLGSKALLPVIRAFLARLRLIQEWFAANRSYAFYSSSILLCYDAQLLLAYQDRAQVIDVVSSCNTAPMPNGESSIDSDYLANYVNCKMIDFTHLFDLPDKLQTDENYQFGLFKLIEYLETYAAQLTRT